MARGGAAVLVAAALLSIPGSAGAYCRSKACDDKPNYDDVWQTTPDPPCVKDQYLCLVEGQVLHWPATCIGFAVHQDGSGDGGIDFELASSLVEEGFAAWQAADCGGAPPSLVVKNLGPVSCREIKYWGDRPNANIFMFRDSNWPYDPTALAITTVQYDTETAEIYGADVELNSADPVFTVGDDLVINDLRSTLTHEIGHFLGLGHSEVRSATMWWRQESASIAMRSLDPDDEAGICEIYPPGRKVGAACEPRHGFTRTCPPPPDEGCSIAAGKRRGGALGWVALGWVALGLATLAARRGARGRVRWKRPAPRR